GPRLDRRLDPDDPEFHRRSGQLLDRALTGGPMDGAAWDDLTAHLAALPAVYLHPPDAWADLAHRLLSEMIVADGLAWAQREAALGRLLRHPSSGASTIAACAGFAADPAHQVFAEPLSDLHVSDHPDAVRLVLGSGRTEATGAAGVVVTRVAAGATGRLSRELPGPDGVLLALLDELLFSPDPGDRLHAGFLIAATPYRETVAAALTGELRGALRGDGTHAVALLAALGARRRPVVAGPAGVPAGERGGLTSPPRSPRPPLLLPPVRHVQHDPAMGTGTGQYEHPEGQGRPDTHRERRRALEAAAEDHVAQCLVAEHVDHVLAGNGRVRTDRCPQVHAEQRPTGRVRRQRQTLPLGVHLAVLHVVAG